MKLFLMELWRISFQILKPKSINFIITFLIYFNEPSQMSSSFHDLYFPLYSSNCFLFSSASQVSYLVFRNPAELQSSFLYISHSRGISRSCQIAFATEGFDYSKRFSSRLNSFEAPQVCQTACSAAQHLPECKITEAQ